MSNPTYICKICQSACNKTEVEFVCSACVKKNTGTKHSVAPWTVDENGETIYAPSIHDAYGEWIASCPTEEYDKSGINENRELDEANARRIVACVNFCHGAGTVFLERFPGGHPLLKLMKNKE